MCAPMNDVRLAMADKEFRKQMIRQAKDGKSGAITVVDAVVSYSEDLPVRLECAAAVVDGLERNKGMYGGWIEHAKSQLAWLSDEAAKATLAAEQAADRVIAEAQATMAVEAVTV